MDILEYLKNELKNEIKKYGLNINEQKSTSGFLNDLNEKKPLIFLGYIFYKGNNQKYITSVKYSTRIKLEKRVISLLNNLEQKKDTVSLNNDIFFLNRLISGSVSRNIDGEFNKIKRYGWLFFYSQINDETLLWKLDKLIQKKISSLDKNKKVPEKYMKILKEDIKSFVKAYYELKYNFKESNYFFNPDSYTPEMQLKFLELHTNYSKITSNMSEKDVDKLFKKVVYKIIKKDKKDLLDTVDLS